MAEQIIKTFDDDAMRRIVRETFAEERLSLERLARMSLRLQPTQRLPVRFRNGSGEEIPAYGVMRVTDTELKAGVPVYVVEKPNGEADSLHLVNGRNTVGSASTCYGVGSWCNESTEVLCDATNDTPANGEGWGPTSDEWYLVKGNAGFVITGGLRGSGSTARTWARLSTPAESVFVYTSTVIPPVYMASGELYGSTTDEGIRVRAVDCTVWEINSDDDTTSDEDTYRLVATDRTVKVVNWTHLPATGLQAAYPVRNGLYAIMHNDTENDAYFEWGTSASSTKAAGNNEIKLIRGPINYGAASSGSGSIGALGTSTSHFAYVSGEDVFVRFPGRYMITYGATFQKSQGNLYISTTTGAASTGTSHTHSYNSPAMVGVKCALICRKWDAGTLTTSDFTDTVQDTIVGSVDGVSQVLSIEKTYGFRHEVDATDKRWFRVALGFQCLHQSSYVNNSTTPVKVEPTKAWVRIRPVWKHPFDSDKLGTDEYVNGFPGSIQWWGSGTQPRRLDVDGQDAGAAT